MCGDTAIDVLDSEFVDSAFVDSAFVDFAFMDFTCVDSAFMDSTCVDSAFVHSIRQGLSVTRSSQRSNEQPTIYRVPERIRQHEKNKAYEPLLVSIGPYHHNKQSLVPMEEHKWRYLQAILCRNPDVSLEVYHAKIKGLEVQARSSYSESIELDSDEFLKMMFLDGCFIVELFAKHLKKDDDDDPIYGNNRLLDTVITDMFLLENQLPYCILQCIFSCVFPDEHVNVLIKEAIGFYESISRLPLSGHHRDVEPYRHLLHLIHYHLLPSNPKPEIDLKHPTIPSAEKLEESGIKFKRKAGKESVIGVVRVPMLYLEELPVLREEAPAPESREADKDKGSVLDIEFNKHDGVMEIPYLFIDDFTIRLFRNFVAFEQCYPSARSYFTVYTHFMDAIINTKADVEILRDKRILEHACGSDEELALLFNGLTKGCLVGAHDFYLSSLYNNVNEYCDTKRHRWRASLMRDYFKNPWSIIALIGAIVVIILTAIQSFFSVYAYARPPH